MRGRRRDATKRLRMARARHRNVAEVHDKVEGEMNSVQWRMALTLLRKWPSMHADKEEFKDQKVEIDELMDVAKTGVGGNNQRWGSGSLVLML